MMSEQVVVLSIATFVTRIGGRHLPLSWYFSFAGVAGGTKYSSAGVGRYLFFICGTRLNRSGDIPLSL